MCINHTYNKTKGTIMALLKTPLAPAVSLAVFGAKAPALANADCKATDKAAVKTEDKKSDK